MAKTIEGFAVNGSGEIPNVVLFPPDDCPRCVTLVLHDGKHERMFTESEVRAAAMAAIEAMKTDLPHSPGHVGRAAGAIGKALLDMGLVLDPA